jgi:hypothetical protein
LNDFFRDAAMSLVGPRPRHNLPSREAGPGPKATLDTLLENARKAVAP